MAKAANTFNLGRNIPVPHPPKDGGKDTYDPEVEKKKTKAMLDQFIPFFRTGFIQPMNNNAAALKSSMLTINTQLVGMTLALFNISTALGVSSEQAMAARKLGEQQVNGINQTNAALMQTIAGQKEQAAIAQDQQVDMERALFLSRNDKETTGEKKPVHEGLKNIKEAGGVFALIRKTFTDAILKSFSDQTLTPLLNSIVKPFGAMLGGAIGSFSHTLEDGSTKVGGGLLGLVEKLQKGAWSLALTMGQQVMQLFVQMGPIGWIVLAIGQVVTLIAVYHKQIVQFFDGVVDWFMSLSTPMKIIVGILTTMAQVLFAPVLPLIAIGAQIYLLAKHWDTIVTFFSDYVKMFSDGMVAVFEYISPVVDFVKKWVGKIVDFFGGVDNVLLMILQALMIPVQPIIAIGVQIYEVVQHWDSIVKYVKEYASLFVSGFKIIGGWVSDAIDAVSTFVSKALDWFDSLGQTFKIIGMILLAPLAPLIAVGVQIWQVAKHWDDIVSFFSGLAGKIFDGLKFLYVKLPGIIWDNAMQMVSGLFGSVWDGMKNIGTFVWNAIQKVGGIIWDSVKGLGSFVTEGIKSLITFICGQVTAAATKFAEAPFKAAAAAAEQANEKRKSFNEAAGDKLSWLFMDAETRKFQNEQEAKKKNNKMTPVSSKPISDVMQTRVQDAVEKKEAAHAALQTATQNNVMTRNTAVSTQNNANYYIPMESPRQTDTTLTRLGIAS